MPWKCLFGAVVLVLAACGGGNRPSTIPNSAFPVVANADLAVGPQRVLVGIVTPDGTSLASPDLPVELDIFPQDEPAAGFAVEGVFIWTVPDVRGLYRAQVNFDRPGVWMVSVHSGNDDPPTEAIPFSVAGDGLTPSVGEPAPSVATPSGSGASLEEISTDPEPDPRFYAISLDQALASGSPTVVVFATPAFCETATCGPMLDNVKTLASDYPEINFVHVEIYQNLDAQPPDQLTVADAVLAWGLPSEPWAFVVDRDGIVTAKFEGTIDSDELTAALESVSSQS
jgi:hypothetical protein